MSAIPYETFIGKIDAGDFEPPPVIAIAGAEDFMREDALRALRELARARGMAVERFDDEQSNAETLIANLRTPSLFGDRTAIVLKSVRRGNKSESVVRFKEHLLEYLERPSKSSLLVFDGETWNGSYAVPKRVKKDHLLVECPEFKPWQMNEIDRFIARRAQRMKLRLASGAGRILYDTCGGSFGLVERELEKLVLIAGEGSTIDAAALRANLSFRGADSAFDLANAVLDGREPLAVELASKVLKSGDPGPALQFLGLIEGQFRKLAKLAEVVQSGTKGQSALKQAGFPPRSPRNSVLLKQAERLDAGAVLSQYRTLLELDLGMKGAASDPTTSLLAGLARMARTQAAVTAKSR